MAKDKHSQEEHPELKPYAPPRHPDANVPEQQFEPDQQPRETKSDKKTDQQSK